VFEKRKAEKAVKAYEQALSQWQAQRDGYTELLDVALGSSGSDSNEIMLGAGEAVFYTVTEVSLVEERRGAGHWEGRSTGVSIPIGSVGGRSVRYPTQRHQRAVPGELKLSQDIGDQIRMRNRQQAVESEPARIGDSRLKQRGIGKGQRNLTPRPSAQTRHDWVFDESDGCGSVSEAKSSTAPSNAASTIPGRGSHRPTESSRLCQKSSPTRPRRDPTPR
jgi:hypothetical protein